MYQVDIEINEKKEHPRGLPTLKKVWIGSTPTPPQLSRWKEEMDHIS